jgi:hypothetical protein
VLGAKRLLVKSQAKDGRSGLTALETSELTIPSSAAAIMDDR